MKDVTFGIIQGSFPTDGLVMKLACQYENSENGTQKVQVTQRPYSYIWIFYICKRLYMDLLDAAYWSECHWYYMTFLSETWGAIKY